MLNLQGKIVFIYMIIIKIKYERNWKKKYNFNSYGFLLDNKLAIGNSNGSIYI